MPKENIKLIPQEPQKPSLLINLLFYFSVFLLLASIISFLFLNFKVKELQEKAGQKAKQIEALETKEISEKRDNLVKLISSINKFSNILQEKNNPSKIFNFISENTHQNVYFKSFQWQADNNLVHLEGATKSLKDLAEQILIFESQEIVSNLQVSNIHFDKEGLLSFSLLFNLPKNFAK